MFSLIWRVSSSKRLTNRTLTSTGLPLVCFELSEVSEEWVRPIVLQQKDSSMSHGLIGYQGKASADLQTCSVEGRISSSEDPSRPTEQTFVVAWGTTSLSLLHYCSSFSLTSFRRGALPQSAHTCATACMFMCHSVHVKVRGQLVGSFLPCRSWDGAQVIEPSTRYSLSQLAGPDLLFCFYLSLFI